MDEKTPAAGEGVGRPRRARVRTESAMAALRLTNFDKILEAMKKKVDREERRLVERRKKWQRKADRKFARKKKLEKKKKATELEHAKNLERQEKLHDTLIRCGVRPICLGGQILESDKKRWLAIHEDEDPDCKQLKASADRIGTVIGAPDCVLVVMNVGEWITFREVLDRIPWVNTSRLNETLAALRKRGLVEHADGGTVRNGWRGSVERQIFVYRLTGAGERRREMLIARLQDAQESVLQVLRGDCASG